MSVDLHQEAVYETSMSALLQAKLSEWLAAQGVTTDNSVGAIVERAKKEVLYDVNAGTVPRSVKSFSELHDYADANAYGVAFTWHDLPADTDDEPYVIAHANF